MEETKSNSNDEIDLIKITKTLYRGKWIIVAISIIATFIGVAINFTKLNSFEASTDLEPGRNLVFYDYIPLNDLLRSNNFSFSINSEKIFLMFIKEFNDYEEVSSILIENEFVAKSIEDLDEGEKKKELRSLAKLFKINEPFEGQNSWTMSFNWHDDYEGTEIIEQAINTSLNNVKLELLDSIKKLADVYDLGNQLRMESLNSDLNRIREVYDLETKSQYQFLKEQSLIAKELGIETNELDFSGTSQPTKASDFSLTINSEENPYYLRGYKAIDKQISILDSRSEDEKFIMSESSIQVSKEILSINYDLSSSQIKYYEKFLENDDVHNWINIDFYLADIEQQNNPSLFISIFIFFWNDNRFNICIDYKFCQFS